MPEQLRLLGEVLRFCDQSVKDLEESAASWMAPFSPITHDMAYQLDYLVRDLEDLRGIQVYFPKRQRFSTLPTIRVARANGFGAAVAEHQVRGRRRREILPLRGVPEARSRSVRLPGVSMPFFPRGCIELRCYCSYYGIDCHLACSPAFGEGISIHLIL